MPCVEIKPAVSVLEYGVQRDGRAVDGCCNRCKWCAQHAGCECNACTDIESGHRPATFLPVVKGSLWPDSKSAAQRSNLTCELEGQHDHGTVQLLQDNWIDFDGYCSRARPFRSSAAQDFAALYVDILTLTWRTARQAFSASPGRCPLVSSALGSLHIGRHLKHILLFVLASTLNLIPIAVGKH